MSGFNKINFNSDDDPLDGTQPRLHAMARHAITRIPGTPITPKALECCDSDQPICHETVGRLYLQTYLEDCGSQQLAQLTPPSSKALVPDLGLAKNAETPALSSRALTFEQNWKSVPVFGGRVSVDVRDCDCRLVSIKGQLATPPQNIPSARLPPASAREQLEAWAQSGTVPQNTAPQLTWYFKVETAVWHLIWHFREVSVEPAINEDHALCRHGSGSFPNARQSMIDAFIDTNNGEVVHFFPSEKSSPVLSPELRKGANS